MDDEDSDNPDEYIVGMDATAIVEQTLSLSRDDRQGNPFSNTPKERAPFMNLRINTRHRGAHESRAGTYD